MKLTAVYLLLFCIINTVIAADSEKGPLCSYFTSPNSPEDIPTVTPVNDNAENTIKSLQCKRNNFCFSLWREEGHGNQTMISQGCWEVSGKQECDKNECISNKTIKALHPDTKFCCCSGDFCNTNFTAITLLKSDEEQPFAEPAAASSNSQNLYLSAIISVSVAIILCIIIILFIYKERYTIKDTTTNIISTTDAHDKLSQSPSFSTEHLKLIENVGQGRYGKVWRGTLRDVEVAIKIFPSSYKHYFNNERDIYCLPFMEHSSLLSYYGCDERIAPDGIGSELLLVLSYAPSGCLQDFLRHNKIDWITFCKMSSSISSGLAHLHTDMRKGDDIKPCVSHRDLNTRNILVKTDLSCCICDLGLAMKISGSKYYSNGEELTAQTKSLNDVGTLRYMAPEVLEGAVNLRDCESSLKQIDVYALGLVLWELSSRCSDIYLNGVDPPLYRMPFETEIGLGSHPTFEQMQVLVSRHKARPLFPETWKDTLSVRLLKETIEDCWDQDAEARLTSLCVDERLRDVAVAWERQQRVTANGVSPTVNLTMICTNNNNNNNNNNLVNLHNETTHDYTASNMIAGGKDYSVSEGTVETLLTLSPSEPTCKNAQLAQQIIPLTLQPYQGRNPCLERNLMTLEAEPQLSANGNTLVDLSSTTTGEENIAESQSLLAHDSLQNITTVNSNSSNSNSNATSSTALRPATPIPFLQNAVYDNEITNNISSNSACPKQPNVQINSRKSLHMSGSSSRWSWLLGNGMRLRLFSEMPTNISSSSSNNNNNNSSNRDKRDKKSSSSGGSALLLHEVVTPWDKSSNLNRQTSTERPNSLSLADSSRNIITTSITTTNPNPNPNHHINNTTILNVTTDDDDEDDDDDESNRMMRPPSDHVKTPRHTNSGRFSLYDDPINVIIHKQDLNQQPQQQNVRAKSVPGDIMNC